MRLYFLRHGMAEDYHADGDFSRALTTDGRERLLRSVKRFSAMDVDPRYVYSSPLVRARQTADVVADVLDKQVEIRDVLGPGFNINHVAALIEESGGDGDVMFVGHEPDFSATIGQLIGGGMVTMKKGGLARIDVYDPAIRPLYGSLVWMIAPKVFDVIAR